MSTGGFHTITFRRTDRDRKPAIAVTSRLLGDPPATRSALAMKTGTYVRPLPPANIDTTSPRGMVKMRLPQERVKWAETAKARARALGLTNREITKRLSEAGVEYSYKSVGAILNAQHIPSSDAQAALEAIFATAESVFATAESGTMSQISDEVVA